MPPTHADKLACHSEGVMIDVSIIIVSYNTRDLLSQCLRSIKENVGDICIEIFVVDNASTDESGEMVNQFFPDVKLILNSVNVGFSTANNQAMAQSVGRYILLLNPDTIVLPGAIQATLRVMDDNGAIGISTCKVLNADLSFQPCYGDEFPSIWTIVTGGSKLRVALSSIFFSKKYLDSFGFQPERIATSHPVAWAMGAFMMIRRSVYEQISGLDENLFMYGEEPDYCYRAMLKGWQIWYLPGGRIIHLGGQSTSAVDEIHLVDWFMTNSVYFHLKHKGKVYTVVCLITALAASTAKLALFSALLMLPSGKEKKEYRFKKRAQMLHTVRWCLCDRPRKLLRVHWTERD